MKATHDELPERIGTAILVIRGKAGSTAVAKWLKKVRLTGLHKSEGTRHTVGVKASRYCTLVERAVLVLRSVQ